MGGPPIDVHPLVSRPIPLAGYLTVTPFVGGRATAYSTTVTGSHVPVGGGPPIEDTNGEWRVRGLLEERKDANGPAPRRYPLAAPGGVQGPPPPVPPPARPIPRGGPHILHVAPRD